MLHKTIKYVNLDGQEVSEDYWFRITREKMAKKAASSNIDYFDSLTKLKDERDGEKIMKHFDDILLLAVGKREGDLFIQNEQIERRFRYSGAFDAFFWELLTMGDSGAEVIASMYAGLDRDEVLKETARLRAEMSGERTVELPESGVIEGVAGDAIVQAEKPQPTPFPQSLQQAVQETAKTPAPAEPSKDDEDPKWLKEGRNPTRAELMKMSKEEMQFVYKMREAGLIS